MFDSPEYFNDMSVRLSEVLDDIGVKEAMVLKRRRALLLEETIKTTSDRINYGQTAYLFGSLSEGTTSIGLRSDIDMLNCDHRIKVIQDYGEWKKGYRHLMIIQDDNVTSPGYCLLQLIRRDSPLPDTSVPNEHYVKVGRDKVLLKNTVGHSSFQGRQVQHGPAWTTEGVPGMRDRDRVLAYECKSWPHEATAWLHRQGLGMWPTPHMKRFAENNGCFVVPVGSKVSQNQALEWRISYSQAERCLIYSLNITQIRCYVLMKMILKTHLNPPGDGHVSSFMCKTVLLHLIENTHSSLWVEHNLLICLSQCLHVIFTCILQGNCPHYIIHGNNLMAGRFSADVKRILVKNMYYIMQSYGLGLFEIQIDKLGQRLQHKQNTIHRTKQNLFSSSYNNCLKISGALSFNTANCLNNYLITVLHNLTDDRVESNHEWLLKILHRIYIKGSVLEKKVSSLLTPFICSSLGTVIASSNIQTNKTVSLKAMNLLYLGLNSDVLSGRLKLASVLYSIGHTIRAEGVLGDTERRYDWHAVNSVCHCHQFPSPSLKIGSCEAAFEKEAARAISSHTAFCIHFSSAEKHCIPQELQYEMFRSTKDDLLLREKDTDDWMDWAVVDSVPYLYFLLYKTYGQLQRYADQQRALRNLKATIIIESNLGHRETALNLLGQCMEKENQAQLALNCYTRSLKIRERNNAARVHICVLLARSIEKSEVERSA